MTLPTELTEQVRRRANFGCEYCGVTETDSAGQLTVDHYRPRSKGGGDVLENLLYSCYRCNLHKADYWPARPGDPALWNPRLEPMEIHLLTLADGTLYPITATGEFTLQRLRLNRPLLVSYRLRRQAQAESARILKDYRELLALLEQLHHHQATLLEEHRALLREQRALLKALLRG